MKNMRRRKDTRTRLRHEKYERIHVSGDNLSFVPNAMNDVGLYVAANPLTQKNNYFEIEIIDKGLNTTIGIGLVPYNYRMDSQPGWRVDSVGYHADNGNVYVSHGYGRPFGPRCNIGDRMGCGINFQRTGLFHKRNRHLQVYFTCNGDEVGTVTVPCPPEGLFPAVGLHSAGEVVRLDLAGVIDQGLANIDTPDDGCSTVGTSRAVNREKHRRIQVTGNHLSFITNPRNDVGLYVAADPLIPERFYFEIQIINKGLNTTIGIGLVPCNYPMDSQPGWRSCSVGYHADDGRLFVSCGSGRTFGPSCSTLDRMGCGIKFQGNGGLSQPDDVAQVYFTRNGKEVGTVTVPYPPGGLFPAVGLHSTGEMVRLNLAGVIDQNVSNIDMPDEGYTNVAPSDVRNQAKYEMIQVRGDNLRFITSVRNDVGLYMAVKALTPERFYFEIQIINTGLNGCIAIGLVPRQYPMDCQPGWQAYSVGYHADDGRLFVANGSGTPFGERCSILDHMGCGIIFNENQHMQSVQVFFTRNGQEVGRVTIPYPPGGLFPAVGLHSRGEEVRLSLTGFNTQLPMKESYHTQEHSLELQDIINV